MQIGKATLNAPNPRAGAVLARLMDRYAGDLLDKVPHISTYSEHVRRLLIEELKGGNPSARDTAKALHMSERTLHRHLKDEGTNFRKLLKQLRHEHAVKLLENPRYSIAEVGFLLGFSELSSFYMAFKQWTGKTPVAFRREMISGK